MARVDSLNNFCEDIASAIKAKKGDNSPILAADFDAEIQSLPNQVKVFNDVKHSWFTVNTPKRESKVFPIVSTLYDLKVKNVTHLILYDGTVVKSQNIVISNLKAQASCISGLYPGERRVDEVICSSRTMNLNRATFAFPHSGGAALIGDSDETCGIVQFLYNNMYCALVGAEPVNSNLFHTFTLSSSEYGTSVSENILTLQGQYKFSGYENSNMKILKYLKKFAYHDDEVYLDYLIGEYYTYTPAVPEFTEF